MREHVNAVVHGLFAAIFLISGILGVLWPSVFRRMYRLDRGSAGQWLQGETWMRLIGAIWIVVGAGIVWLMLEEAS